MTRVRRLSSEGQGVGGQHGPRSSGIVGHHKHFHFRVLLREEIFTRGLSGMATVIYRGDSVVCTIQRRRQHQPHLNVELLAGEEVVQTDHLGNKTTSYVHDTAHDTTAGGVYVRVQISETSWVRSKPKLLAQKAAH